MYPQSVITHTCIVYHCSIVTQLNIESCGWDWSKYTSMNSVHQVATLTVAFATYCPNLRRQQILMEAYGWCVCVCLCTFVRIHVLHVCMEVCLTVCVCAWLCLCTWVGACLCVYVLCSVCGVCGVCSVCVHACVCECVHTYVHEYMCFLCVCITYKRKWIGSTL